MKTLEGQSFLVSACLLGVCCRYDGKIHTEERILALKHHIRLVPVCPEQLGGLSTPRRPAEIVRGRVLTSYGDDITSSFLLGAQQGVLIGQLTSCTGAILQPRSPSCGAHQIYDGTFSRRLIAGKGIFAQALLTAGFLLFEPDDFT